MYYLIAFLISTALMAVTLSRLGIMALLAMFPAILIGLLLILVAGKFARRSDLPESFFGRFWPLLLPWWLGAILYVPLALVYELLPHSYFMISIIVFVAGLALAVFLLAFLISSEKKNRSRNRIKGLILICGLSWAIYLVVGWEHDWIRDNLVLSAPHPHYDPGEAVVAHDGLHADYRQSWHGVNVQDYTPLQKGEKLAALPEAPDLRITENWPRLDGSIALLPLYGAAAKAVYSGLDIETVRDYVVCNNTAGAFDRLLDGEADIYFGPPLSPAQKEMARARNITLTQTPLALEAFVFLVHKASPVENLSQDQVRRIYTKEITNWRDVGGPDSRILAFQRPANSGSQAIMEMMVMKGTPLPTPIAEEFQFGMGDLVRQVAAYRNRHNALGYSFRWYATVQFSSPDIKLLALDGVAPTVEHIRDRRYPVTAEVVAVTTEALSEPARALLDWLTGPQGRELIGLTGYVPLESQPDPDSAGL